jgi:histidinol-phosphate/aromatic aminotransferase/cobyric acid decarboxylase-like protein
LGDPDYYADRYRETGLLRTCLADDLRAAGLDVISGAANFILCFLPSGGPNAAEVVERCKAHGLYIRDASSMSRTIGPNALRIAVKDGETNERIIDILQHVLKEIAC